MINPNEFIKKLNKLEISAEHYCFLHFLLLSQQETTLKTKEFNYFFGEYYEINKATHDYKKLVNDLEEKEYLINNNKSNEDYQLNKIIVTKKFKDLLFVSIDEAWKEVLNIYPLKIKVKDKWLNAQTTSNPSLKKYYYDNIIKGGNIQEHATFILLTESYYEKQSEVTHGCGLEKYLYSWDSMKKMIEQNANNPNNKLKTLIAW